MVTAGPSSHSNSLLRLLISLLEVIDAVQRWLSTTWYCLTRGIGPAKAGGTNPPPPAVVGIIIAEPTVEDISFQMVANVAAWCMPYDTVHQVHLYEPSGHLKRSQPQLEQKLAVAANNECRNLVIRCGWSVSKPSYTTPAFEQQQKRQQRLASAQKQQSAHPTQQRSWGLWLTQHIVGTNGKQQDATPQLETSQVELLKDTTATCCANQLQQQRVGSCISSYSTERQQMQAEAISTDTRVANAGANSNRTDRGACVVSSTPAAGVGIRSARPNVAAITVRILSGEDAFLPVIEAAAERCRSCEPASNLPKQPHWLQDQEQGLQEQQKQPQWKQQAQANGVVCNSVGCSHDPRCSCSAISMDSCSFSNGLKGNAETGAACSACQQQQQQQQQCLQACITPCSSHRFCKGCDDDRRVAVAQHKRVQQQQQQQQEASEQQVVTVAGSSTQVLKQQQQQQQQNTCKESPGLQAEQEQCLPCCQTGLAQINQQQDSQTKVASELQQQQRQHNPQQKQQGSMLPELAAVSSPDIAYEPQLLLVFGPALTLAGYPPFHTRAAEVHYMGRLAHASRPAVAGAIARYCKVLQRHGA